MAVLGFSSSQSGLSGAPAGLRCPTLVEAEPDPGVGGSSFCELGWSVVSGVRARQREIPS